METYSLRIKSPKKEEEVPASTINSNGLSGSKLQASPFQETDIVEELEGILGIYEEAKFSSGHGSHGLTWDFMGCGEEEEEEEIEEDRSRRMEIKIDSNVWENKQLCLNLNLNYQEVIDAWSDRRPLLTDSSSPSAPTSSFYTGEERARREARVLRYREKRQNRLFSKKIRYQVRKLNADKRPRLKGRFVRMES